MVRTTHITQTLHKTSVILMLFPCAVVHTTGRNTSKQKGGDSVEGINVLSGSEMLITDLRCLLRSILGSGNPGTLA